MSASGSDTESLESDAESAVRTDSAFVVVESSSDSDDTNIGEETTSSRSTGSATQIVIEDDNERGEDVREQVQGPVPSESERTSPEIGTVQQGSESLSTSLDDFRAGSRKRKRQPSESANEKDDDPMEGESCPICFEEWSNAGQHRLASLKCGHLFGLRDAKNSLALGSSQDTLVGPVRDSCTCTTCTTGNLQVHQPGEKNRMTSLYYNCIERWIRSNGTCPQCKAKSRRNDIRLLYARQLKVLDTAERDKALQLLEEERRSRCRAEEAAAQLQLQNQLLKQECHRMHLQVQELQQASSSASSSGGCHRTHEVATAAGAVVPTEKHFVPFKNVAVAQSQARVVDFERSNAMLLVSRPSAPGNQLFRGSGILKVSLHDTRHTEYVNIHSQRLRDIAVSSRGDAVALTASEDKSLRLTSLVSNTVVQKYDVPSPAWSCCWHSEEDYYFFAGLMNGRVLLFDVRNTAQHVDAVGESGGGTGGLGAGPAISLAHVKPSVVASSGRSSGLLVGQSTRLSFCRHIAGSEYRWCPLLQGSVTSVSWEGKTRHGLVSLRPGKAQVSVKHTLFQLAGGTSSDEPVVSFQMVGCMMGGSTARLLSRSTLFQHPEHSERLLACAGDECAKAALLYDCSSQQQLQKLTCLSAGQKEILHVHHFQHHHDHFLTALTETNLALFRWGGS